MNILLIFPGFILAIITIVIYEIKLRKPKNKVRFYVARDKNGDLSLWFGKPHRDILYWAPEGIKILLAAGERELNLYGLHIEDYDNLKWEDEPIEVFLNLEDLV